MQQYECPRCGYKCNQRNDLRKHFNRKKICHHNLENISIEKCFEITLGEKPSPNKKKVLNASHMHPKLRKNSEKCIPNASHMHPSGNSESPKKTKDVNLTCEFCGETFTKHQNYYRHKKFNCKKKGDLTRKELEIIIESRDQTIVELKYQIGRLLDKVGTTNHTTNNTFNFVVNAFGKEDTSYIPSQYIQDLIKSGPYDSIPKLLKEIHFHPEHSENLNVKIPNKKLQMAQIFNGVRWEYKDKKETIENMTDKAYGIINKHYHQTEENTYMEQFRNDFESGNKETHKKIKDQTELTILNNQSSIVKSS